MRNSTLGVVGMIGLSLAFVGLSRPLIAAPQQTRAVHVSVTTEDGTPVTDLTAADFEVKEGGRTREVSSAVITSVPMRMAILVADDGTGGFQQAMVTLIQPLIALGEFKLVSVVAQPETVVDYTTSAEALVAGIEKMGPRGGQPGSSQLIEAIAENAESVGAPGRRPVIVVMRMGGSASSQLRQEVIREMLRKAGTQLFAISPANSTGGGGSAPINYGGTGGQARTDYAAAESVYRNRNLESVLNDGSRQTGGRHVYVNGQTILKSIEQLTQELQSQYQLSWTLAAGEKPSDRLEVSVKRRGLRVNAPNRIAN
jgi:VWFA-related protein